MAQAPGDFLGNGWRFPIDGSGGAIGMVANNENIAQSILLILRTNPGERVMLPEFGCGLGRLVFAPGNAATLNLAQIEIERALHRWEPRISVTGVTARMDPMMRTRVLISIDYTILDRNSRHNLVYPFYLEGSA